MSSRIHSRLRALERHMGVRGVCRECGGRGQGGLMMRFTGGAPPRIVKPGCHGCGKARIMKVIVLDEPPPGIGPSRWDEGGNRR